MRWMTFFWCWVVCCCCSVTQSCLTLHDPMDCSMPDFPVLHYLLELAQTHIHWVNDTISSSVNPFFSCPQFFPASESFPVTWLFVSSGHSIGASASVLPVNIQGWFPLELTGLISLLSKWLSRVFSSTIVQKHQFSSAQPSFWSNSHLYMTSGKTIALTICTVVRKVMSLCVSVWESLAEVCIDRGLPRGQGTDSGGPGRHSMLV